MRAVRLRASPCSAPTLRCPPLAPRIYVLTPAIISFPMPSRRLPLPIAQVPKRSFLRPRVEPRISPQAAPSLPTRLYSAWRRFLPRRQDDPYDENRTYGRDIPPSKPAAPKQSERNNPFRASYIAKGLQQEGSSRVVLFAIAANTTVMIIKTAAWMHSGSAAMLAEVLHSCADIANQALLFVGIKLATRPATTSHPYGFANEPYVWALVSAVGSFFLGCVFALYAGFSGLDHANRSRAHGLDALYHPQLVESTGVALGVLGLSFIAEGAAFLFALKGIIQDARREGVGLFHYLMTSRDPLAITVLFEDGVACTGVVVAAACIQLSAFTGNPVYDALGSIIIGTLLGAVSGLLIKKNREFLIGRAMPAAVQTEIVDMLKNDPVIYSIRDVKGLVIGRDNFRFKAELNWNGAEIARQHLATFDVDAEFKNVDSPEKLRELMIRFGAGVIDRNGEEVDRVERAIKNKRPEIKHVDLESD